MELFLLYVTLTFNSQGWELTGLSESCFWSGFYGVQTGNKGANMGLNLFTRQEYKNYKGITSANSDGQIDSLIPKVSQFAKTYCKRTFLDHYEEPKVQYTDGGFASILLVEAPVVSISSVQRSIDYGQTWTTLIKYTDWVLVGEEIRSLHPSGYFETLINGYKVTYFAGFETTPEDLKVACMDLLTYYKDNEASVKSTKAAGTNSTQIEYIQSNSLPAHIRRVFDLYQQDYA